MLTLISPGGQLHCPFTVASLDIANQTNHPPPAVKRKIVWADAQIWGQLGGEILASGAPGDFSRSYDMPTHSPISTMRNLFWLRQRPKAPNPPQAFSRPKSSFLRTTIRHLLVFYARFSCHLFCKSFYMSY